MKIKVLLFVALAGIGLAGATWFYSHQPPMQSATDSRKVLYYTCSMHPWVREHQPGPCPVCGMKMTPIYENTESVDTNMTPDTVKLAADSISVINVQTDVVERRPVRRTLHLAGTIEKNSSTAAWFTFTAYQRDLAWLKIGQTVHVTVPASDQIYDAKIKLHGTQSFADADFDMMTGSVKVRAEISNPPVEAGDFGKHKSFSGLHADGHLVAETEETLAIPRSAVISRGSGPMVYVGKADGHYTPRAVLLGRVGDEFVEVLAGLKEGEKIVTTGNVLIDSEAQLTVGR